MKKIILLVIILSLLIPIFTLADKEYTEEQILISILEDLNGEFVEGDISINGEIINSFVDKSLIIPLGEDIKNKLGLVGRELNQNSNEYGLQGNYIKEEIFEETYSQLSYYGYDENDNPITIILSSYFEEENDYGETYLYINIIKNEIFAENNDIIDRIKGIFVSYDKPMDITTCIIGAFHGKEKNNIMEKRTLKAFKRVKGVIMEEFKDISLLSFTAHTPYIEKNISYGDKKINLNLAIRYNDYEDKTYIWIGTPIITSGY